MYEFYGWKPHVTVAARRGQATRALAALRKSGQTVAPVVIQGRTIARTFWGNAWCTNLERYSDYSNRLPRGRSYVRNGSVIHLQIEPGAVTALVSGSELYQTRVSVAAIPKTRWKAVCRDCTGAIDSLVELLQGRLSSSVMDRMCQQTTGLFPAPAEIDFSCSCPDWASMCKHVAAVLYGIGARLDHEPELLFALRKVDVQDLITAASTNLPQKRKGAAPARVLETDDLSAVFGIEIAHDASPRAAARPPRPMAGAPRKASSAQPRKASGAQPRKASSAQPRKAAARAAPRKASTAKGRKAAKSARKGKPRGKRRTE